MLSGESAIGPYGQKAISVLQMTSSRMELWSREENRQSGLNQRQLGVSLPDRIAEQICSCAVEMGTTTFPHHSIYPSAFIKHIYLQSHYQACLYYLVKKKK